MDDEHIARRHDDGRKVFIVGPVERWILGVAASLVVGLVYAFGQSMSNKLYLVSSSASRIEIAQAVTTNDINEIKAKQALMAQEVAKIPRLEIQVQNNSEKIRDINNTKRLK